MPPVPLDLLVGRPNTEVVRRSFRVRIEINLTVTQAERRETHSIGVAEKTAGQGLSGQISIGSTEMETLHIYKLRGPQHSTDPR
jgi:hypothetical protein